MPTTTQAKGFSNNALTAKKEKQERALSKVEKEWLEKWGDTKNNRKYLEEWVVDSAIAPELACSNLIPIDFHWRELEALYSSLIPDPAKSLKAIQPSAQWYQLNKKFGKDWKFGGWYCESLDPLTGKPMSLQSRISKEGTHEPAEIYSGAYGWGCFKPNKPRTSYTPKKDGGFKEKTIKYEHPHKCRTRYFFLRVPVSIWKKVCDRNHKPYPDFEKTHFWEWVCEEDVPVSITEGAKKAAALLSVGEVAIAASGVNNSYCTYIEGEYELHPDLLPLLEQERIFNIIFDYENKLKKPTTWRNVNRAAIKLAETLEKEYEERFELLPDDGMIQIVSLPGEEKGVDDFLVAHSPEDLFKVLDKSVTYASELEVVVDSDKTNYHKLSLLEDYIVELREEKYLSDLKFDAARLICIKSAKGTGKSTSVGRLLRQLMAASQKVLVPTHRVSLVDNLSRGLGVESAYQLEGAHHLHLGLSCCLDSMQLKSRLQFAAKNYTVKDNLVLFIDEVEQFLNHLLYSTTEIKEHRAEIIHNLAYLVKIAMESEKGGIIIADADLTDLSVNFFKQLAGLAKNQVKIIQNSYQAANTRKLHLFDNPAHLWLAFDNAAKQCLEDKKNGVEQRAIAFYTEAQKKNSKLSATNVQRLLRKKYSELNTLVSDRLTTENPKHPAYGASRNPNQFFDQTTAKDWWNHLNPEEYQSLKNQWGELKMSWASAKAQARLVAWGDYLLRIIADLESEPVQKSLLSEEVPEDTLFDSEGNLQYLVFLRALGVADLSGASKYQEEYNQKWDAWVAGGSAGTPPDFPVIKGNIGDCFGVEYLRELDLEDIVCCPLANLTSTYEKIITNAKNIKPRVNPNQIDIFIFTPVIQTGVSIDRRGLFCKVFGYVSGVSSPGSARQGLSRVREDCDRFVCVPKAGKSYVGCKFFTSHWQIIKNTDWKTTATLSIAYKGDTELFSQEEKAALFDRGNAAIDLYGRLGARTNQESWHYWDYFYLGIENEGYEIIREKSEDVLKEVLKAIAKTLKLNREEAYSEEIRTLLNQKPFATQQEYEASKARKTKTEEEHLREKKHEIGERYLIPISEPLIRADDDGYYSKLKKLYYLTEARKEGVAKDKRHIKHVKEAAGDFGVFAPDLLAGTSSKQVELLEELGVLDLLEGFEENYNKHQQLQKALLGIAKEKADYKKEKEDLAAELREIKQAISKYSKKKQGSEDDLLRASFERKLEDFYNQHPIFAEKERQSEELKPLRREVQELYWEVVDLDLQPDKNGLDELRLEALRGLLAEALKVLEATKKQFKEQMLELENTHIPSRDYLPELEASLRAGAFSNEDERLIQFRNKALAGRKKALTYLGISLPVRINVKDDEGRIIGYRPSTPVEVASSLLNQIGLKPKCVARTGSDNNRLRHYIWEPRYLGLNTIKDIFFQWQQKEQERLKKEAEREAERAKKEQEEAQKKQQQKELETAKSLG